MQETSGATILANILPGLGIDEFLTRTDVVAGITSNFLTDALGSPLAVTDIAGTVQTSYTYETFGRTTTTGALNTNSYQYTGRENDGTGLYYMRARYYSSVLQRFINEDPIGIRGGDLNLYAYVSNNSLNFIDPLGLRGIAGSRQGPPTPFSTPQSPDTLFEWMWDTFIAPWLVRERGNAIERAKLSLIGKFKCDTRVYICWDQVPRLFSDNPWNVRVVTGYNGMDADLPIYDPKKTVCIPHLVRGYDNKCCQTEY